MTFDDAMAAAKECGARVRDDASMDRRWVVAYFPSAPGFFNINPHTGTNYGFTPTEAQKLSNKWRMIA